MENATKKGRGTKDHQNKGDSEPWIERATAIFSLLDTPSAQSMTPPSSRNTARIPSKSRNRRNPASGTEPSPVTSPNARKKRVSDGNNLQRKKDTVSLPVGEPPGLDADADANVDVNPFVDQAQGAVTEPKKIPRVILRLGPAPNAPDLV